MQPISSLFEGKESSLQKTFDNVSRSERADLIKVFHERVLNKNDKQYPPAFIASKLSIYSLEDLRYMISDCKLNWNNELGKYFWCLFKKP